MKSLSKHSCIAAFLVLISCGSLNKVSTNKKNIDSLDIVWPIPKGVPPPPINMEEKNVLCYGKNKKGKDCKKYTSSIIGLCKKHAPKFSAPVIMSDF